MADEPKQPLETEPDVVTYVGRLVTAEGAGHYSLAGSEANFTMWRNATGVDGSIDITDPRVVFFFHLGFAINQWALVERELFGIFSFLLGSPHLSTASHLFYSANKTISARFALANTLVDGILDTGRKKRWDGIKRQIGDESPLRNRLAHDPSFQIVSSVGSTDRTPPPPAPPPEWRLASEPSKRWLTGC